MAPDRFPTAARPRAIGQQAQARVYRATGRPRAAAAHRPRGAAGPRRLRAGRRPGVSHPPVPRPALARSPTSANRPSGPASGSSAAGAEGALGGPGLRRRRRRATGCTTSCRARPASPSPGRPTSAGSRGGAGSAAANRPWYDKLWDGVRGGRRPLSVSSRDRQTPPGGRAPESLENAHMEPPPPPTDTVPATEADVAAVRDQLGRAPRAMRAVAHRCPCGLPDVVETAPRLADGTPVPDAVLPDLPARRVRDRHARGGRA